VNRARMQRRVPKVGWLNRFLRMMLTLSQRPVDTRFAEYRTKTKLFLPFDGEWYVFWGGRTVGQNRHAKVQCQRFAYDFLVLRQGKSSGGSGEANTDYYCFGLPVYAPGDGTVVQAEDDVPDNLPGILNARQLLGNHVILDHGNGEFSFLVHLKGGSVRVRTGDRVHAGDMIGECGNSGHSSEAHLHYHLQTAPVLAAGEGLPAQFVDYIANAKKVGCGEPVAGETIRSQREHNRQ